MLEPLLFGITKHDSLVEKSHDFLKRMKTVAMSLLYDIVIFPLEKMAMVPNIAAKYTDYQRSHPNLTIFVSPENLLYPFQLSPNLKSIYPA